MALKRVTGIGKEQSAKEKRPCAFGDRCPQLFEHLTATEFADGAMRATSTLTVFSEHGSFKGCLNNKEEGVVAFVTSSTLTGILDAFEEGLEMDALDWRRPHGSKQGQAAAKKS